MSDLDWLLIRERADFRWQLVENGFQLVKVDLGEASWQSPIETWRKPGQVLGVCLMLHRHSTGVYMQGSHPERGGDWSTPINEDDWHVIVWGDEETDFSELTAELFGSPV